MNQKLVDLLRHIVNSINTNLCVILLNFFLVIVYLGFFYSSIAGTHLHN